MKKASAVGRRLARTLGATALLSSLAACTGEVELPPAPDMSALVQAYKSPNGRIDSQTAVQFGKSMADSVVSSQRSSPIELAGEMVHELQDVGGGAATSDDSSSGSGEQSVNGSRIDVAAIVRLHHVCRGWGDTAQQDEANGWLDMTATLDQQGLIPVVWGNLEGCRVSRGDYQLELDGAIRIRFGQDQTRVGLRHLAGVGYLVEYEGQVTAVKDGEVSEVPVHSHFQIFENREVRFLINLGDGTRVIGILDPQTLTPTYTNPVIEVSVLEEGQRWNCSLNVNDASGNCTSNGVPREVVSW